MIMPPIKEVKGVKLYIILIYHILMLLIKKNTFTYYIMKLFNKLKNILLSSHCLD